MGIVIGTIDRPPPAVGQAALQGKSAPNVIVITVDDQSLATFDRKTMPGTFGLTDDGRGRQLSGYASPPLCCPSRAGFLTGQYPQNHGVFQNSWGLLREPGNTLPAWLQAAGYKTGFAGKYLNKHTEYPRPAAGFDFWFGLKGSPAYYDYEASVQGRETPYGSDRSDYSTTVVSRESERFISRRAQGAAPFFLWSAYFAPHARRSDSPFCGNRTPLPLKEDYREFQNVPVKLSPSYNERDVTDKPSRVRGRPLLDSRDEQTIKERFRCTLATMQEVDRGVAGIQRLLARERIDDETVIFYTSDNGFYFGEHRLDKGKALPYREAIQVPLLAHVPPAYLGGREVARTEQPVANIDLAPTILDLADAEPCTTDGDCRTMDGRSILPLLEGNDGAWPDPRSIGFQLGNDCKRYAAVLQGAEIYVEWPKREAGGGCEGIETELYDLSKDPFQLENRLFKPTPDAIEDGERLSELVARLRVCAGIEGRDEQRGNRPFC